MSDPDRARILDMLRAINRAWLERKPQDLFPLVHPEIVVVFPSFAGSVTGRKAFMAGFEDFCLHAQVLTFEEWDHQIHVSGNTAVASFAFEMIYRRKGPAFKCTGRDLWVFARHEGNWLAIWRTMPSMVEVAARESDLKEER